MPDKSWVEQVVQRAVSEVLDGHIARIQNELVTRVLQEIEPQLSGSTEGNPSSLLKAISAIQTGTTQREILRVLLDNAARYSGRVALFVVKTGAATGWQARGFANSDDIKDFGLDVSSILAAQALQSRTPAAGTIDKMDRQFVSRFKSPAADSLLVLPLVLKEKVAALVYADAGTTSDGKMDRAALELLVVTTSAWLEVVSLRKQSAKEGNTEAPTLEKVGPAPSASPSMSDPFAAHAPSHRAVVPPPVQAPVAVQASAPVVVAQTAPVAQATSFGGTSSAAAAAPAPVPVAAPASTPADDAEVHRKAQRFARLLVDEIKLYNQAKVAEGRKNRDLYDRLKEDVDKSFSTYQKRYGNTAAASAGYFQIELVKSLAEEDISLMGPNFQR